MLDRLPTWAQHLILALAAVLLAWAGQDVVPVLRGQPGAAGLAGAVLALLVAALTPFTRQYGAFKETK